MTPIHTKQSLTVFNFFTNYISDPLSNDLSQTDKVIALVSSILLAPLTLGVLHVATYYWRQKRIEYYKERDIYSSGVLPELIRKIESCPSVARLCGDSESRSGLTRATLSASIQSELIEPFYKRPYPSSETLTVPVESVGEDGRVRVEWKRWKELTQQEKVEVNNRGTLSHNALKGFFAPYLVDWCFCPPFSHSGIEKDPRAEHGIDHAIRTSLFSAVFMFLYQKYHPDYHVTERDVLFAQFAGAGHDLGRQTDGPDVYDQESAEKTVQSLRRLGVKPIESHDCFQAIAQKDNPDLQSKSLIAKCVENADSIEFSRLPFHSFALDPTEIERERTYLDIFREFHTFHAEGRSLKDGLTFQEFTVELDQLRIEMKRFIAYSHRKKFRKKCSEQPNYYEAVVTAITPYSFPLLHAILRKVGVLAEEHESDSLSDLQSEGQAWLRHGLKRVPTRSIQRFLLTHQEGLEEVPLLREPFQRELEARHEAFEEYRALQTQGATCDELVEVYAKLPPILQDEHPLAFLNVQAEPDSLAFQFIELKKQLSSLHNIEESERGFDYVKHVYELYQAFPKPFRDSRDLTVIASALQRLARRFVLEKNRPKFEEVIRYSEDHLCPDPQLEESVASLSSQTVELSLGTREVRRQQLRIESKSIDGTDWNEISFELSATARERLVTEPGLLSELQSIPSHFEQRKQLSAFSSKGMDLPFFCQDLLISSKDLPQVSLRIGATPQFWNQYHLVRLRFSKATSLRDAQKLLFRIGLMTTFMQARSEDLYQLALSRTLTTRFPNIVYSVFHKKEPQEIYDALLSQEQKDQIDQDLQRIEMSFTGNRIEMVQPRLIQEAYTKGGRAFAIGIQAGSAKKTAKVLSSILKDGFLSSQERFQRGILSYGNVPTLNNFAGSANQVFSRILTHNLFQSKLDLTHLQMAGQMMVLLDLQAIERMPYAYFEDTIGVRNPRFTLPVWTWLGNEDIKVPFHGREELKGREELIHCVDELNQKPHVNNECMFDQTLSSRYIRKILVSSEEARAIVLHTLYKKHIHFLHGEGIEKAVVVASRLTPELEDTR